jgi:hypothetical protein
MAYNVKFLRGASTSYANLATKDERTFYYTTDDQQLYLGAIKLSNGADLDAAIARISANEGEITAIKTALGTLTQTAFNELKGRMDTAEGKITALETGKADKATTLAGYGITNAYTKGEVDDLIATIESGDSAIGETIGQIRTDVDEIKADYLKKADKEELQGQITANANAITLLTDGADPDKVDGVKDLIAYVETHGATVTGLQEAIATAQKAAEDAQDTADSAQGYAEGVADNLAQEVTNRTTAISGLQTQIDGIKTTVEKAATQEALQAEIDRATGVEGGLNTRLQAVETVIGEVESVATAIETAKGEAIAAAATDATNKADAAKNASKAYTDEELAKITLTTGSVNGTVAFKGEDVAVKGLGSAAYAAAEAFDAAGSAESAKGEAIAAAATDATNKANNAVATAAADATTKADTAEANAKTYVDTALTWGTIAE